MSGGVAVQGVLELGDRGGNLEAKVQNFLLSLETHILGPLHHAREVALGLNVLANAEVAGALLEKRVLQALAQLD